MRKPVRVEESVTESSGWSQVPIKDPMSKEPILSVFAPFPLAMVVIFSGCGAIVDGWGDPSGSGTDAATSDGEGSEGGRTSRDAARPSQDFDAVARPAFDAGAPDVFVEPPQIHCTLESCEYPPSTCVDDSTMRWFSGACTDAGKCEFTPYEMHCDSSSVKPDCFQGSCRVVVLR